MRCFHHHKYGVFLGITSCFFSYFFFAGGCNICPECGSDHVVQLAGQSTPRSSTPIKRSSTPQSEDDHLDINQSSRRTNKVTFSSVCFPFFAVMYFQNCSTRISFHLYRSRMITQTAVSAAVLSSKLPPPQKTPPSSQPREAPSSPGMIRVIPPASPTTQSAKVRRIWLGATTTPLLVQRQLKSNLQEDPLRMVRFYFMVFAGFPKS